MLDTSSSSGTTSGESGGFTLDNGVFGFGGGGRDGGGMLASFTKFFNSKSLARYSTNGP